MRTAEPRDVEAAPTTLCFRIKTSCFSSWPKYVATAARRPGWYCCDSGCSDWSMVPEDRSSQAVYETALWVEETLERPNARHALLSSVRRRGRSANAEILS